MIPVVVRSAIRRHGGTEDRAQRLKTSPRSNPPSEWTCKRPAEMRAPISLSATLLRFQGEDFRNPETIRRVTCFLPRNIKKTVSPSKPNTVGTPPRTRVKVQCMAKKCREWGIVAAIAINSGSIMASSCARTRGIQANNQTPVKVNTTLSYI